MKVLSRRRCAPLKWADIKKLNFAAIENRTAVDLKDKWRNLLQFSQQSGIEGCCAVG